MTPSYAVVDSGITGASTDSVRIEPGETHDLLSVGGAGVIRHLWITANMESPHYPRELVLRMYRDGASTPSVAAPLGDFFCLGHARVVPFSSAPFSIVTGGRPQQLHMAAFNCWFAMPFGDGARVSVTNEGEKPVTRFYYYVDFEERDSLVDGTLRFHAHYQPGRWSLRRVKKGVEKPFSEFASRTALEKHYKCSRAGHRRPNLLEHPKEVLAENLAHVVIAVAAPHECCREVKDFGVAVEVPECAFG